MYITMIVTMKRTRRDVDLCDLYEGKRFKKKKKSLSNVLRTPLIIIIVLIIGQNVNDIVITDRS